jgi:hypothetical protein
VGSQITGGAGGGLIRLQVLELLKIRLDDIKAIENGQC